MKREDLYRVCSPGLECRDAADGGMPTLAGYFSVFGIPTTIQSRQEGGPFIETIARGAFAKSMNEQRDNIKIMFNHGRHPMVGDLPLGPINVLREDDKGAYYETQLLDAQYVRELLPALREGLLGQSFRFSVMREDIDESPKRSATNPDGYPERTVREAKLYEFGPVVNPQYPEAKAGIRSITDEIHDVDVLRDASPILLDDDRLRHARAYIVRDLPSPPVEEPEDSDPALDAVEDAERSAEPEAHPAPASTTAPPSDDAATKSHLVRGSREPQSNLIPRRDKQSWLV